MDLKYIDTSPKNVPNDKYDAPLVRRKLWSHILTIRVVSTTTAVHIREEVSE